MKPIIDPMFFYLVSVIDSLIIFLLLVVIGIVLGFIMQAVARDTNMYDIEVVTKPMKIRLLIAICLGLILCFVPSSSTIIKMEVVKRLTPDTISQLKKEGKDFVSFLTDQIEDVLKKDGSK